MALVRTTVAVVTGISLTVGCGASLPAFAAPTVVSINLCSDQLVLSLADTEQLLSVSWLAADPEESMFASRAADLSLNYGSAEEILLLDPEVIVAGAYTGSFTKSLLRKLGYEVVDVEPARNVDDIARNVRQVGAAIGQMERAQAHVGAMFESMRDMLSQRPTRAVPGVIVRPGGFTSGRPSLADSLLQLAGIGNAAVDRGLDRWGSLSIETLLRTHPELIVIMDYRAAEASLAAALLEHPAIRAMQAHARTVHVPARLWACGLPESLASVELLQRAVSGGAREQHGARRMSQGRDR